MSQKTTLLILILVAIAAVIGIKASMRPQRPPVVPTAAAIRPLPKLLELGSVGCQACAQMEPIISELKGDLAGKVSIEFTDVALHPDVADKWKVKTIPTQVFLDAGGNELHRHIGFYPKEQILVKMKDLGMIK